MSGMDETRDAVGVDSCWLEGKDGKGKKVAHTFCVTPLLSEPVPSPYTRASANFLGAPFVPCSLPPSCHPYPQSSRSSQPATLQLSAWQIGVARLEAGGALYPAVPRPRLRLPLSARHPIGSSFGAPILMP